MRLDVIPDSAEPWYADSLRFTCTQCGNCCTGGPGHVWISIEEIERLAEHLKISPEEVVEKHCRKVSGKFSLREHRNSRGEFDCTFLKEVPAQKSGASQRVVHSTRVCTIYPVRPLQCRTWPFWSENLRSAATWEKSARGCPGMGTGRSYSLKQIESLRDAKDWPKQSPTSA